MAAARDQELIEYVKELKDIDLNDQPQEVSDIIEEFQDVVKQLKN